MKLRNPKEVASAVTRIKTALTDEKCAEVVERSTSLIRKWADPDHPSVPNIMQALQLDAAYVSAGHGEPPILKLYADLLDASIDGRVGNSDEIVPSALMIQAVVGDLSELIRDAINSEDVGNGGKITPRQRAEILELIDRLEDETDRLEDAVEAED